MSDIGSGVNEIRVRIGGEHRVLYVAKFEKFIYVLHAFEKKTPKADIDLGRLRYRDVLRIEEGTR